MIFAGCIQEAELQLFAEAIGDYSSIHMDADFARKSRFRQRIVHGMLPVLVACWRWATETGERRRLSGMKLQFESPIALGEELQWRLQPEEDRLEITIIRTVKQQVATRGTLSWGEEFQDEPASRSDLLVPVRLEEWDRALTDCAVGDEANLLLHVGGQRFQALSQALGISKAHLEPNLLAALSLSTLVGMRLPGRRATFLECNLEFSRAVPADAELNLKATVQKVMTGSSKIKATVELSHQAERLAQGHVLSLVNPPQNLGASVSALLPYLDLGIRNKVALITGSSRGIGEATAKLLALHGARVVVHAFQGIQAAQAIAAEIREHGGEAIALACNLADSAAIQDMFQAIQQQWGPVQILVNNAVGSFSPKGLEQVGDADFLEEFQISLLGSHHCSLQAIPGMKAAGGGKIVNIGTIASEIPVTGQSPYITIKSALVGYTRSLAVELAASHIQVNMVVPNMTNTSLLAGIPTNLIDKIKQEKVSGKLLEPAEVAQTIAFLVSNWSNAITGQKIVLNQGEAPFL